MANEAKFTLALEGDGSQLAAIFAAFKREARSAVTEVEQTTKNVKLFANLDADLKKTAATVDQTRVSLVSLTRAVDALREAGEPIGKELATSLAAAEKAAAKAEASFIKQSTAVDKLRTNLTRAGVDLSNLAAAEAKLAVQSEAAAKAEANRAAQQLIGLKTTRDATTLTNQYYAALNTLAANGSLSGKELVQAQELVRAKVAEVRAGITGAASAAKSGATNVLNFFQGSILPALGLAGGVASVATALNDAIKASKEYQQRVAEIGTVTNLSRADLRNLGDDARALAASLGVDINSALKALFELIRSGVPEDNALNVLRVSAEASKAALIDVSVGVKAANLLLDAFGADIADLPALFDKITRAAKDGGATLEEFANSAGPLLNVARASGFAFDDLLAVLTVLVDKSGNAEKSFADLTKILARIDTTETRQKLDELGITGTSLVDIFTQIGQRGLSLEQVLGLNLSAGGAKSAASLAALTKNANELPAVLDRIKTSAGTTKQSLDALLDSPKERSDRFNAQLQQAQINIGNLVGSGSRLAQVGTFIFEQFNQIPAAFEAASAASNDADASFTKVVTALLQVDPAADLAARAMQRTAEASKEAGDGVVDVSAKVGKATADLTAFAESLSAGIQALQTAAARDIGDIDARADAQIAALSRAKDAEAATAAATLAIRRIAAQQQLEVVQKLEDDVTKTVTTAIAAREKVARESFAKQNADAQKQADFEKRLAAESAAARIAAIAPVLAKYQELYAGLIALAQNESAKAQSFADARIDIARKVESELRNIRLEGLSGLDQFVERNAQIDRLISEGRKAAANGDIESANGYFNQAISESNGLKKVINDNGVAVITDLQAQTARQEALKKIAVESNDAFGKQGEAAKIGADATLKQADLIKGKVTELQQEYDTLKKLVAAGLELKITTDEASIRDTRAKLDELTKPRTVVVTTVYEGGAPPPGNAPTSSSGGGNGEHFARGGLVGVLTARPSPAITRIAAAMRTPVQRFARGGSVFGGAGKVPGTGSGDTVPALLQAGQFVVRKAASRYYGGGLMGLLARGFAKGGQVTKEDVEKWAQQLPQKKDPTVAPVIDPKKGFQSGDSFQDDPAKNPPVNFDTRPIPEALITAINVLSYAREMLNSVGTNNPLLGSLKPAILSGIAAVERDPTNKDAVVNLLRAAETIGANPYIFAMWGKTTGAGDRTTPIWFVDWLAQRGFDVTGAGAGGGLTLGDLGAFAKQFFGAAAAAAGGPNILTGGGRKAFTRRFAAGGSTDTVPAMLTPGEFVIRKSAVQRFGSGLMHAINNMALPRAMLANMLAPPVSRFAMGGPVGSVTAAPIGIDRAGDQRPIIVNFKVDARDLIDDRMFYKNVAPKIRESIKRSRR